MASITSWTRLEPLPRTGDLEPALQARIADPLWLLARQWQTLEFAGDDAGSPIVARITAQESAVDRVRLGPPGDDDAPVAAHDDRAVPLEAAIEAEPVTHADTERLRVASGLQLLRRLRAHGAGAVVPGVLAAWPFRPGEDPVGTRGTAFRTVTAGRVPDGEAVRADVVAARERGGGLPAPFSAAGADPDDVLVAVEAWLAWGDQRFVAGSDDSWDPRHLEYRAAVGAATAAGPVVLAADEYADGRLDWHSFSLRRDESLGDGDAGSGGGGGDAGPRTITRTVIPVPATYAGMPVDRFWQFEDAGVNFGAVEAGPADLTRLVLVEFALVYGNDWWVVPLDLRAGSLCTLQHVDVVDTFGVVTRVGPMAGGDGWGMYDLDLADDASPLFLPPVVAGTIEGDAIESVTFLRDEAANMAWAVEHTVQEATGDPMDRTQAQVDPGGLQEVAGGTTDAEVVYRLATPVPDHWVPMVPVREGDGVVLERRMLVRHTVDGVVPVPPRGRVLQPPGGHLLRVEEQEIPRDGVVVDRSWQLARWTDGSTHLWLGRRRRAGRGEGRSGLRFDVVEPMPPQD